MREAQRILNLLGYNVGPVDGILGPRTTAGIRSYQADQNLTQNGTINASLMSSLRRVSNQ